MNIASYQIQNVIRAYGQRIGRKGISRLRLSSAAKPNTPDVINISAEAKQRQITERITSDIISRVRGGNAGPDLSPRIVERLNKELGGKFDILPDQDLKNGFKFRVIDAEKKEVVRVLSSQDSEKLIRRMYSAVESANLDEKYGQE